MQSKSSLYIASDHRGYQLKKRLVRYLENELKTPVTDMGPTEYVETDDYPDYAGPLCNTVAKHTGARGILICGSGNGVCISANKIKGIRAALGYNITAAEAARADLDSNVLCLSAKLSTDEHAMAIVKKWLQTSFSGEERHARRIKKISELEG